ncbi:MAG TPA: 2Fe-2S iron-sulfur cluster-binding protein [Candidatus Binatia bacterium]|nr:2Fe-2S iron-sulfur cluster-binding protein [Candidatus Binatia bacterium]
MRLPPRAGERIDRSQELTFFFEDEQLTGFAGDTIGSALFAGGRRVFSRSFKYHRPRGLLCCSGRCPNCLMEVDGVPNVRVCVEPLREGARVKAQNVVGTLEHDLMAVVDKLGGPFTPVGFYYRTFIRPRRLWPLWERLLRNAAGLGRVDEHAVRSRRYDTEHRRAEVLVIGGGEAGLEAARRYAAEGRQVVLVDESSPVEGEGFETIAPAVALGVYEGRLVPVAAGRVLYRIRAERIVVAAGAVEQPLVFPGNDLVGVMQPNAVQRLVGEWSLKPGERAVVVTADDRGSAAARILQEAGTEVAEIVDLRERSPRRIEARGKRGRLASMRIDGRRIACDLAVISGGAQPAYSLLAQAGARVEYDASRGVFVPRDLPPGIEAVGSVLGEDGAPPPPPSYEGRGKRFVCLCEDVTTKDLARAIAEGFDSIELAKRYTTVTMGPCQGKLCHLPSIRLYARETGTGEAHVGTTTARPPWQPVALGVLAGRPHEPAKRTAIHHRHREAGATMMWTGAWRRPHSYGDPAAEVRAVHEAVGVIDVSTLGKLIVAGPDAVPFLERLYPNRFGDLGVGRIRYGVLSTDGARIMDDGTIARLGDEEFYVTTTSTGAEGVVEWFEWWNAVWKMDVEIEDVTGALGAVNVAGPRARDVLARLTDLDVAPESFAYLDAKRATVADVPCLLLRIGFVGELGYEIHCPSPYAEHLWDSLLQAGRDLGIRPFGLEPQRVLRLEKMHILVGQDTDSESNALEAGMPWIVKLDKDDFVGKWALEEVQARGFREQLVGFEVPSGIVPPEGGQVVVDGRPAGRVTSARWSEATGKAIGMAWVPARLAEEGASFEIRVDGRLERASVRLRPFFDPDGTRLRS